LKKPLDGVKKKISDVLKLFKDSLEEKSNKKIMELEKKMQEGDLIPQKYIETKEDNVLEKLEP
jgi:hypothetical protein